MNAQIKLTAQPDTARDALNAIQRPGADRDADAKQGSAAHLRWVQRIDRIEAVLWRGEGGEEFRHGNDFGGAIDER